MDGKTLHHAAAEEKENWRTTTTTNSKTIRRLDRGREQHGDGTHFSLVVALDVQYSTAQHLDPVRAGRGERAVVIGRVGSQDFLPLVVQKRQRGNVQGRQ